MTQGHIDEERGGEARLAAGLRQLVEEASSLTLDDISPELRRTIGLVFADLVGVIATGACRPEMQALLRESLPGSDTGSRVLAADGRLGDPAVAAWLNGTAGTFLELDEGIRPTGHPGVQVIPAAFAVAEVTRVSGAELMTAIAAGYEVAARLFGSFTLPAPMHPHGHFGAIGAATAVAMLRGSDPVDVARIAATQPMLTGWDACLVGATARNSWAGHANRAGIQAEMMHRAGMTGSFASLLSVLGDTATNAELLTEPVDGAALAIGRNYFKFHSMCALGQGGLDAVQQAWRKLGVDDPWSVSRIDVATVTPNLRIAVAAERNHLSTRFSLPYGIAAALVRGSTDPDAFEWDPVVAEYAERVHVEVDPDLDAAWPTRAPARVRLITSDGSAEAFVANPRGHHSSRVTHEDLRDKFVGLLSSVDDRSEHEWAGVFDRLADLDAVSDCARLPLPEPRASTSQEGLPHAI